MQNGPKTVMSRRQHEPAASHILLCQGYNARRFFAHSHDSPLRPHSRDRLSRSMMRSSMS
jgi:hypothetical protein